MHRRNINRFDAHKTDLFGEENNRATGEKRDRKEGRKKKNQRTHYSKRKNLRI